MPARLRSVALLAVLLVCAGAFLAAQAIKVPPVPARWATDEAGFLNPDTIASLDGRLGAFARETGTQVLVYVGRTSGDASIEEWAVKVFEAWKVGRKGLDDGLVLFIMAGDRRVRIEVGYGLEERVPDARASRIIREVLLPGFRDGRQDAAVTEAVADILALVSGRAEEGNPAGGRPSQGLRRGRSTANKIFAIVAGVFFLILFITNPSLALALLFSVFSGGGRGEGGGFSGGEGGGFSGGGGRSGGGGASGSW